jgi:hypothetical protein
MKRLASWIWLMARPLSPRVREGILAAVLETPQPRSVAPQRGFYMAAAACLALAGVGATLALMLPRSRPQAEGYARAVTEIREALVAGGILTSGPSPSGYRVALPEVIASPFAAELQALTEDTRSAARFLTTCVAMDLSGAPGE